MLLSKRLLPIHKPDPNMNGDDKQADVDYGQLMACLMRERVRFATESEFQVYALESVRRFIVDVRALDIELTMRPRYLKNLPSLHKAIE